MFTSFLEVVHMRRSLCRRETADDCCPAWRSLAASDDGFVESLDSGAAWRLAVTEPRLLLHMVDDHRAAFAEADQEAHAVGRLGGEGVPGQILVFSAGQQDDRCSARLVKAAQCGYGPFWRRSDAVVDPCDAVAFSTISSRCGTPRKVVATRRMASSRCPRCD